MRNVEDFRRLAEGLLQPVLRAGALQLTLRRAGLEVERKSDSSPVTAADRQSEMMLVEALSALAPDVPIVAEEAAAAGAETAVGDTFFLIDPLDGTREYVRGGDDFTINIGLIVKGLPVFGMVYAPAKDWLFATIAGDAAVEAHVAAGERARSWSEIDARPIRTRNPVAGRLTAVASRSHRAGEEDAFLDRLGVVERVAIGSSLKFCLVARGDADVYPRFGSISEWDTAAGHAVLAAAGGAVLSWSGQPWLYGNSSSGFTTPPFIAWGRPPGAGVARTGG